MHSLGIKSNHPIQLKTCLYTKFHENQFSSFTLFDGQTYKQTNFHIYNIKCDSLSIESILTMFVVKLFLYGGGNMVDYFDE